MKQYGFFLISLVLMTPLLLAEDPRSGTPAPTPQLGIMERLGETLPLDLEFYDENGYLVPLRSIIDRPVIFTFVYYRCPSICSPLLTEVARVVDNIGLTLGKDYKIITLSFNHRESPALAKEKKVNYLNTLKSPVDEMGWRFMTGDSADIRTLTDAAGFYFKEDGIDFIHAGALIVVSPEGKLVRYLLGVKQIPFDAKLALSEAWEGKTGPTVAKVLNFCYSYDREGRVYTFNFLRVAGLSIVGLIGIFMLIFVIIPKKKK